MFHRNVCGRGGRKAPFCAIPTLICVDRVSFRAPFWGTFKLSLREGQAEFTGAPVVAILFCFDCVSFVAIQFRAFARASSRCHKSAVSQKPALCTHTQSAKCSRPAVVCHVCGVHPLRRYYSLCAPLGTARNCTEQPVTAWNSLAQHGTAVRNSTEQHGTARNSAGQHGTARSSTEQ
eukprot:gene14225-biopygen14163